MRRVTPKGWDPCKLAMVTGYKRSTRFSQGRTSGRMKTLTFESTSTPVACTGISPRITL
jgi:hypothetical protein